jgi:hypothetical protein
VIIYTVLSAIDIEIIQIHHLVKMASFSIRVAGKTLCKFFLTRIMMAKITIVQSVCTISGLCFFQKEERKLRILNNFLDS